MLLTVNEAAGYSGYTAETIRIKIRSGELPAVRRGRRYFVSDENLNALFRPV
ncbi:helix-turn-helix domain-containing protein [Rhodococcus wratislaviensis]|uniref:helix-turn-helix domain-containing protein n=1 Tax=Rhodococcus wratislaviensis TaxID=44752 RepID=UPI003653040A